MNYYEHRKIITFLAKSLSRFRGPELSNVIPYPLYTYFPLRPFLTILIAANRQFLNLKLKEDLLAKYLNHRKCKHLQFCQVIILFYSL